MSSLLNVATRALTANQVILQTTGNNIANVNTPGYSRQSAVLQTTPAQFTGSGYVGKGVEIATIERAYSEFLARQATLASTVSAADTARADKLNQIEKFFPGGAGALGAAVSDMLNAFSDVASSPTDLTARTVALTRVDETAQRMSAASSNLDGLQVDLKEEISQKITTINILATSIAKVNEQIARAKGNGQPPNDLLDKRDQLIVDLNKLVQTTSIEASDGTIGLFVGGSQPLVLGNGPATIALASDDFGDPLKTKIALVRNGITTPLDENAIVGGEVPGLLRFQNSDLAEARSLLGRYTVAITSSMNEQHALGLDLNGAIGTNLFTPADFGGSIFQPVAPATLNTGITMDNFTLAPSQPGGYTQFEASDYEISFNSATAGTIVRRSDGTQIPFDFAASATNSISFDGLTLTSVDATNTPAVPTAAIGDRLLLKPFSISHSNIKAEFSNPRNLAVASPWAGKMGGDNNGSLQLATLTTYDQPVATPTPVTLKFISANQYIRSDDVNYANYPAGAPLPTTYDYVSGSPIQASLPNNYPTTPYTYNAPLTDWSVTLQGVPKPNDTYTVFDIKDTTTDPVTSRPYNNGISLTLNSGNASAMMDLRDVAMFDGSNLTDGYAGIISQIGVRTQSANYTAEVSASLAASVEQDRASLSGVNLDEEAAKLLQYQQAYQACAKVIQIAQGVFDTLIQTISR